MPSTGGALVAVHPAMQHGLMLQKFSVLIARAAGRDGLVNVCIGGCKGCTGRKVWAQKKKQRGPFVGWYAAAIRLGSSAELQSG